LTKNGGKKMKKLFGKKDEKLEKRLIEWVNKQMENKKDMEEIKKSLIKKYGESFTKKFIKRNYAIEPADIELPEDVEDKDKIEEVDKEMENLKEKSKEKEAAVETSEDLPEEPEGTPEEKKKEEIPIQLMSTYHIELLNQVAAINENLKEILKKLK